MEYLRVDHVTPMEIEFNISYKKNVRVFWLASLNKGKKYKENIANDASLICPSYLKGFRSIYMQKKSP